MNTLATVTREFLEECRSDHVGLWTLVGQIRSSMPNESDVVVRDVVFKVLKDLLEEKQIVVGMFTPMDEFEVWDVSPLEAIQRIMDEWTILGRDPDIGEIAWFICPALLIGGG